MEGSRPTRGRERAARAHAEEVVEERRGDRSDLGPRILVAIPAIIFAVFIVVQGGVVFAAGAVWVPLHHSGAVARIDPATNGVSTPCQSGPPRVPAGNTKGII